MNEVAFKKITQVADTCNRTIKAATVTVPQREVRADPSVRPQKSAPSGRA